MNRQLVAYSTNSGYPNWCDGANQGGGRAAAAVTATSTHKADLDSEPVDEREGMLAGGGVSATPSS